MREMLDKRGIIFWTGDGWEQHFPEFYHTTFHTHNYVRRHWSQWFEVVAIREGTVEMPQDIVVLRRGE